MYQAHFVMHFEHVEMELKSVTFPAGIAACITEIAENVFAEAMIYRA